MPNDERTPLLTEQPATHINKHAPPTDEEARIKDSAAASTAPDGPKIPGVNLRLILPAMAVGIFLAAMDNTIVVSSYGAIGSDMKELNKTSWISTAYLLTTTSFQPLYGKLSDIFGRKPALLFSYAIFGIGCLCCGLARSMGELIAARAFAGIGGGGMTTIVSILMNDIVPLRSRGTFQGLMNIVFASGAAIGAPLGGILADSVGWRWAFLGQFPVAMLAISVVSVALHLPSSANPQNANFKTQLKRVDFLGAGVLVLAVFALLFGLDRGGNLSITDTYVIASLCTSLVLFALFGLVEVKIATEPFAPLRIVQGRTVLSVYLSNFFCFAGYMAILFYLPLYYQAVSSLTAGAAGLRLVPAIAGAVSGSLFGGLMIQKTGKYYYLTVFAYTLFFFGTIPVFLATGILGNSTPTISAAIVCMGFGSGMAVTSTLIALIAAAGHEDQAVATAVSYLFRALGQVMGVSVSSMLVQGSLRRELTRVLDGADADEIIRKVRSSLSAINTLTPATAALVLAAYRNAVHLAFLLGTVLAFFSVVSCVFIREKTLGR
ncbi:major facilitator superfamily domain-containing protein [Tuber borchii]|uniref:Major facilitator superfamily domain-containing protein n=1 Tax=Tuber borchii TaxID=42251 RepID=A0A2T6ZZT0_TUBBO|nr:major facilitator superfamily domain-containing protein [Tuber borchii]